MTLLHKITEQFYTSSDQKGIVLSHNINAQKLFAWIDINIFEKILHNLLSNAIKFTPKDGKISIKLQEVEAKHSDFIDGHIEISVEDN